MNEFILNARMRSETQDIASTANCLIACQFNPVKNAIVSTPSA